MSAAFKLIDKLLANPNDLSLIALNKLLTIGIPFNAPHGFKIQKITSHQVVVSLPNRKLNHNHLGGVHACAMATVGEFCAGIALISSFGISKYRLIMSEMNCTYSWQGRVDLEASCERSIIDLDKIQAGLDKDHVYLQPLETVIVEKKSRKEVARIKTTWQLKNWEKVKTKR